MDHSYEDLYVKLDSLISGIKMIDLHIFNFFQNQTLIINKVSSQKIPSIKEQQVRKTKELNVAHCNQNMKMISDLVRKTIKDMSKIKIVLPPLLMRPIHFKKNQQNFMRFEHQYYGIKFVFVDLLKECLFHIEIYKKINGAYISSTAFRKLEQAFMYQMHHKILDGIVVNLEWLQSEGRSYLEDVVTIFNGQRCSQCNKYMAMNGDLMVFLPPTIRDIGDGKDKKERKYYHESCL